MPCAAYDHPTQKMPMECLSDTLLGQVKTLLLATDASRFGEGAMQEAFFFSQTCLAKLIVLHVVPTQRESLRAANFALRQGQEALAPYFDHIRSMAQAGGVDLVFPGFSWRPGRRFRAEPISR